MTCQVSRWFSTPRMLAAGAGVLAAVSGVWAISERGAGTGPPTRPLAVASSTAAIPDPSPVPATSVAPFRARASDSTLSILPNRPPAASPIGPEGSATVGRPEAIVRIPALGPTWSRIVFKGSGVDQLRRGLGHIRTTASPGQVGNYVLAGHRSGVPDPPLRRIDNVAIGAIIVVQAGRRIWTYRVNGRELIDPSDTDVLAAVPRHPELTPTRAVLTLITCWPANGHSKRVVVHATLASVKP